jgi:hypothetical protein
LADVDDVGVDQVSPTGLDGVPAGLEDERVLVGIPELAFGDPGESVSLAHDIRVAAHAGWGAGGHHQDGSDVDQVWVGGDGWVEVGDVMPTFGVAQFAFGDLRERVPGPDGVGRLRGRCCRGGGGRR